MIATAALVSGRLFALGLGLGGMTQPAKVVGFLDVGGNWDPSLASVMAIEPGLVLARISDGVRFIGTAGGLLRAVASEAVLLTPVAVLGDDAAAVVAAVDAALAGPDPEHELRQAIERLESGLLREVRGGDADERW